MRPAGLVLLDDGGLPLGHLQTKALLAVLFFTLARVYYLLAGPRLAEAHDSSTVVPLTGSARSAPKPLTISNLLHSQHKDVMNEPIVKTRLAQIVFMNGHLLNVRPKGMCKAEDAGRCGRYEGGGAGRRNQDQDTSDTTGTCDLEGEGRGREVQGHGDVAGTHKAEGAGRHGMYEAKGAGRQGMYEASGQATELDINEYRDRKITKNTFFDDSFWKNREPARRHGKPQQGGAGVGVPTRLGASGRARGWGRGASGRAGRVRGRGRRAADTRAPTDFYQTGTKQGDLYQAGTKQGVKDYDEDATETRPEALGMTLAAGTYEAGGAGRQGEYEDGGAGQQDTEAPTTSTRPGSRRASRSQGEGWGNVREGGRPEMFYYCCLVDANLTLLETAMF